MIFSCPKCTQGLKYEESQIGEIIECPHCKETIEIPDGPAAVAQPQPDPQIKLLLTSINDNVSNIEKYVHLFYILVVIQIMLAIAYFVFICVRAISNTA